MARFHTYTMPDGLELTPGDVVSVEGRRRRTYRFRAHVVRPAYDDEHLELIGERPKLVWGKVYTVSPERVTRERRGRPPKWWKGWWKTWKREQGEDVPVPTSAGRQETLTCQDCGEDWQREVKRGRKPSRCPACKN